MNLEISPRSVSSPSTIGRTAVLLLACLSYFVIGVIHPPDLQIGDKPDLYLAIHVLQLFSIWGVALGLWRLTQGIDNRAARVARAAILPYAIFYSAFDAVAGIAIGVVVLEANAMSASDREVMVQFLANLTENVFGFLLFFGAALTWLIAAIAASLALRGQAHFGAIALMILGALIFAVGHPQPTGPIGIGLFAAGVASLYLVSRASMPAPKTDGQALDAIAS
jgi:hypothetical protein